MSKERVFADGFIFKRREDAPEFVIGNISIKVDEAIAFLKKHEKNGWVNLDAKTGRTGNPYLELNTYERKGEPNKAAEQKAKPETKSEPKEELPF